MLAAGAAAAPLLVEQRLRFLLDKGLKRVCA